MRRELGWGPRRWRGADSLRLAGDHAQGVTARQKPRRNFYEVIKLDGFAKSHQRAPCGAPKSMAVDVSH